MPALSMPDTDLHELVAAYALDALDDDDREAFERHLGSCERCADELAGLRETAASLAYANQPPPPPPALRDRILESARAERPNIVPFPRRYATPALSAAAAIAAVVALGLGIWSVSLSRSLDDERSAREATQNALVIVADANASQRPLSGADGSLVVARTGAAALVICGLDSTPSGKTYEAWVLADGGASRAGLFQGGRKCIAVRLTRPVPGGAGVAVTIERDGGVDQPSKAPFIRSLPA
jgi:anti-sigma-K factor RskA